MTIPHKLAVLLHKLTEAGCGPIRTEGAEFRCRCPAHADNGPSLYVAVTESKILVRCGGGCTLQEVCDRLDHPLGDLFFDGDEPWVEANDDFDITTAEAAPGPASLNGQAAGSGVPPAGPDQRHAIYADLLAQLELGTEHFDDLRRRGLTADEITHGGYRTADATLVRKAIDDLLDRYGRDQLLTVPGFADRNERVTFLASRGYLIPVRDPAGKILALKIRHDAGHTGGKYTYASTRGASCGSPVHVPLGVPVPSGVVRLTEGELKADVATALSSMPTVSAPGVGNWRLAVPVLKALGARKVLLAFDRDGKAGTLAATEQALYGLTAVGFTVELEWWDGAAAKGIDDLLVAGGKPEVVTGLAAAVRVRARLESPGPEAPDAEEPEPAAFPIDVFPPALATYCREVADATGTPPDFAGQTMLVTAGAAIGNSRALCVREGIWYESPRLYAGNVGEPGSAKTPVLDAVVKPYQALQLRLIKEYKDARAEYETAKAEYETAVKENRALPADQRQPLLQPPAEPARPERFVAVDATVESLAPILEENPRGLLMPQDEGVAWVRGMGQYKGGKGNDRQFWLSTWSGKGHLVDRKTQHGVPISIPRPFVNVICGMPPDMLGELADCQGRNDGFLHRILFAFPRCPRAADWAESTVSPASNQAWEETLIGLRRLAMQELDDGVLGYRVVNLSPAAREAWVAWWNAHAAETRGPDLPVQLIGPWGKLRSYAARLTLLLHYLWLVQTDQDEVDVAAASVERAARLIDYYRSHLKLVYGRLRQTPEDNHLFEVLDWLRRQGGQCTVRQALRARKAPSAEKARKLLNELEERGYGRTEWREAANGRKVLWFVFDPG